MPKRKPWNEQEESLLGTAADREIAQSIGRPQPQVTARRKKFGIPAFHAEKSEQRPWSEEEIAQLGADSDIEIARRLGRTKFAVQAARVRFGIPAAKAKTNRAIVVPEWGAAKDLDQRDFLDVMKDALGNFRGTNATYKDIADLCFYAVPRIQAWGAPGAHRVRLPLSARHHIWLAVKNARKE